MIPRIAIRNFRSIHNAQIELSPLTVIIGANGSGKSNLVKALQFLADIPKYGLQLAVSRNGGIDGILPKAFSQQKTRRQTEVSLQYIYRMMGKPTDDSISPAKAGFDVRHELRFRFPTTRKTTIVSEHLKFDDVFRVVQLLDTENQLDIPNQQATVSLAKTTDSRPSFSVRPPLSRRNVDCYLYWLGLPFLIDAIDKEKDLTEELEEFFNVVEESRTTKRFGHRNRDRTMSFLDPGHMSVLEFSNQFRGFRAFLTGIALYDLRLGELRRDQEPGSQTEFTKSGDNLPSMVRRLLLMENRDSLARVKRTLSVIAPHVAGFKSNSLKTGKEFVEFAEAKRGRSVESWESSDGTLRALAILIALETAETGGIVVIEEPEQNLHPWAVSAIVDHMREVVESRSVQIILTTHSQQVLECVKPEEVRVASREVSKGTKFSTLDEIVPHGEISKGDVGRLWVKGLLSGVPQASK